MLGPVVVSKRCRRGSEIEGPCWNMFCAYQMLPLLIMLTLDPAQFPKVYNIAYYLTVLRICGWPSTPLGVERSWYAWCGRSLKMQKEIKQYF
eukprot:2335719-Amphidinium_carterae.1